MAVQLNTLARNCIATATALMATAEHLSGTPEQQVPDALSAPSLRSGRSDPLSGTWRTDPLSAGIAAMIRNSPERVFMGSATSLLGRLCETVPEAQRKSLFWPKTPNSLGARLRRSKALLLEAEIDILVRKSGVRIIRIEDLSRRA